MREQTWLWGMWGQTWRAHRLSWIHRPVHTSGCKRSVTKDWSFVDEQNPEINSEGHRWNRCNMTLSACEEPSCGISFKLKTGQSKLQKSEWEEWPSPNLSEISLRNLCHEAWQKNPVMESERTNSVWSFLYFCLAITAFMRTSTLINNEVTMTNKKCYMHWFNMF